ncbi:MAG: hypothetical protein HS108_16115 [Planctomycetes bacterium]|jgi:hypothetical protein|nr:hypothetical protein [Planctomycetota bacterium]MCL4730003.1 hypothetical protein [Planctomycetota bacterium]
MNAHSDGTVRHDAWLALSHVVHAANDVPAGTLAATRLLYPFAETLSDYYDWQVDDVNQLGWAQAKLATMPPITVAVGDTFSADTLHPRVTNVLLLPQTTTLDSSSALLKHVNQVHLEDLKKQAPAALGNVITLERTGASMGVYAFLVCREPGNPKPVALEQCLKALPRNPGMRYVLPIWRADEHLDLWLDAICNWQREASAKTATLPQPMLVNFEAGKAALAQELERRLILRGLLVGRANEEAVPLGGSLRENRDVARQLAQLVKPSGPLTPEVFANWLLSGTRLTAEAWNRHEQVLRGI